jgi:hypothetical protein
MIDPVFSQLYCVVKVKTLRAAPFNLFYDNLIEVKIRAKNIFGWSTFS